MSTHVVVIGGGFAGINLTKHLAGTDGLRVTLVDRNNYNYFVPLLYQVATGLLEVSNISTPFRSLFKGVENVRFRLGELREVNADENQVRLSTGKLNYDALVIATGARPNFFGMENIKENAFPMKTIDDARELRNQLLSNAEEASYTTDAETQDLLTSIVVCGAGPTGVELAGMLAEMRNHLLEEIYPELSDQKIDIFLVDAAPTVLPTMREKSQRYTHERLQGMDVRVGLDKQVEDYRDDTVYFADGDTVQTKTLIWAAGVTARRFDGLPEDRYGRGNRLLVDAHNRVEGTDHIYAIGDTCLQRTDDYPDGHPQLANVAMQQGETLAENFVAMSQGNSLRPFQYFDKGAMAIIGRSKATADLTMPHTTVTGWTAWVMWLFIHLFQLINYRNRIKTMWNWTTAYFTQDLSLGMIIPSTETRRPSDSRSP
jgi:NADH dehydrogenase